MDKVLMVKNDLSSIYSVTLNRSAGDTKKDLSGTSFSDIPELSRAAPIP
jgi:hypothetical protein